MSDRSYYVHRQPKRGDIVTASDCAKLIRYKRWADGGLYQGVEGHLHRVGDFDKGGLLQVLDHMHAGDRIFQHHLRGKRSGYERPRSGEPMSFAVLAEQVRELDDWYVDYVGALPEDRIDETIDFAFPNGGPARMRRGDMLLHVALHGTYHRGNAGILLQKNGVAPNDDRLTDFLGGGLGRRRASPPASLRGSVSVGVSDVTRGRHSSDGMWTEFGLPAFRRDVCPEVGDFDQAIAHYRAAAERTLSIPKQKYLTAKAVRLPQRSVTAADDHQIPRTTR